MEKKVMVTASKKVPYLPEKKPISYGIKESFVGFDDDGQKKVFRYLGEDRMPSKLHIHHSLQFNLEDDLDQHNFLVLKKNLEVDKELASIVTIIDEESDAAKSNEMDLLVAKAMAIISSSADSADVLRDMYRRCYGLVSGVTDAIILKTMLTLAKSDPNKVIALKGQISDEMTVFVDKLIEFRVISIQPDMAVRGSNGSVVAANRDLFVLLLQDNLGYKQTLEGELNLLLKRAAGAKDNIIIPKMMDAMSAESQLFDETPADASMTPEELVHVVKLGVKTNTIFEKSGQYEVDGAKFTRQQLDAYYKKNPVKAFQLKETLIALGLYVSNE